MQLRDWASLLRLIIKYGSLSIPFYPYEEFRQAELAKINSSDRNRLEKSGRWLKIWKHLLLTPIIGPLLAFASFYKTKKRWPTYVYHWPAQKLAYIRISKSACTSIQAAILQQQHPEIDVNMLTVNQINYMSMKYIRPHLLPGYTCFTAVRDPVDRLISCYNDKCVPSKDDFFYFQDYIFQIIKPNLPISTFINIIQKIPDPIRDVHFRSQSSFIQNLNDVRVFRLENDNHELKTFLAGYNIQLNHFHKRANPKIIRQNVDPTLLMEIKKLYLEDFESFGYTATV